MWSRDDDTLKIAVHDTSTDSAFELPVGGAAPLDVFNHPLRLRSLARRHLRRHSLRDAVASGRGL